MRTNIELDDSLMNEAFKYTGLKTKKALIDLSLKEFIENHKRMDLRDLKGKINFADSYDYKQMRREAK
jgi:Arc/MetJ family transcription regulator